MNPQPDITPVQNITPLIRVIRDVRVILDSDLAKLYGVDTRSLNQALKRNQERFPGDFAFELAREEILGISQTVISSIYPPLLGAPSRLPRISIALTPIST